MLKALIIVPNKGTKEFGSLLAVARAEARKREHSKVNPPVRSLLFVPELGVYVALYEAKDRGVQKAKCGRKDESLNG